MNFKEIHKNTVEIMNKANKYLSKEDQLWYNGIFYTGATSPEILFIGLNPGATPDEWKNRPDLKHKEFHLQTVKYIDEQKLRLGSRIYKLLGEYMNRDTEEVTEYLKNHVAETSSIYFSSPNIGVWENSFNKLPKDIQIEIITHFQKSILTTIEIAQPKLIFVIGISTFNSLRNFLPLEEMKVLEKTSDGQRAYGESTLGNTKVLISKHLSMAISNNVLSRIGSDMKNILPQK
jgi:hypothetical protein